MNEGLEFSHVSYDKYSYDNPKQSNLVIERLLHNYYIDPPGFELKTVGIRAQNLYGYILMKNYWGKRSRMFQTMGPAG